MLGSAAVTQCRGIAPAPGCGWGSKEVALGKWCWALGLDGPRAKKTSRNRPRKESQILPNSQRGSGKQFPKCIPCFTPRCVSLHAPVCVRAVALVTWPGMGSAACPSHPWAKKMPTRRAGHLHRQSITASATRGPRNSAHGVGDPGRAPNAAGDPSESPPATSTVLPLGAGLGEGKSAPPGGTWGSVPGRFPPWKSPRDGCSAPGAAPALLGMFSWQREPSEPAAASKQTRAGLNGGEENAPRGRRG